MIMTTQCSSEKSFNLVDQPWIPVAGEPELRSLQEVFTGSAPRRLSGNAVDKIVMFRFLLSVVHASSHVADEADWHALTPEKLAENARNYLIAHRALFDLYDPERPFLQFPQLREKSNKTDSCGSLQVNVATGNKVVLTAWNQEQNLSDAEKTVLLLRSACYACGGKRYDSSIVLSDGFVKGKTGRSGTLLGAYGYLHTYMLGDDLWDMLRNNLLTNEEIGRLGCCPAGLGEPFWCHMPAGEDDERARKYRNSYFGRLIPLDKFILFSDSGIVKTDGILYDDPKGTSPDPALTVYQEKKDFKTIWARTEKRPWRQLPAILNFLRNNTGSPLFLSLGLRHLRGDNAARVGIWTGGVEISANSGEQYLSGTNDYVESEFSLPIYILEEHDQWLIRFEGLMSELEQYSKALYVAVNKYHTLMNNQAGGGLAKRAETRFWEQLEPRAQNVIDLAADYNETNEAVKSEHRIWRQVVIDIYNDSCPHETARQIAAWVEASPRFSQKKGKK